MNCQQSTNSSVPAMPMLHRFRKKHLKAAEKDNAILQLVIFVNEYVFIALILEITRSIIYW